MAGSSGSAGTEERGSGEQGEKTRMETEGPAGRAALVLDGRVVRGHCCLSSLPRVVTNC